MAKTTKKKAIKKKVEKEKRSKGRPTDYKPEYAKQAEKLCKLGSIDEELANFFEIPVSTLNNWKKKFPDFMESIKKGREIADAEVGERLFQRATGYEHPDVDIKCYEGQIIKTEVTKHYAPDTTAAIFWLKNRKPKQWRDKQEIDHTTNGEKINPLITLSNGVTLNLD